MQKHEWYANINYPGPYLGSKFSYIASEVNKRLAGGSFNRPSTGRYSLYRVRKSWGDVNSKKGAFTNLK